MRDKPVRAKPVEAARHAQKTIFPWRARSLQAPKTLWFPLALCCLALAVIPKLWEPREQRVTQSVPASWQHGEKGGLSAVETQGIALSWRPRVFLFENFLSDFECSYLINRTRSDQSFRPDASFNSVYLTPRESIYDSIFADIERRLSVLTRITTHPHEEPMCLHRILPVDSAAEVHQRIEEIHHDKVNKEFSTVTVVAYLNDVEAGGETIFPCTGVAKDGTRMADLCNKVFQSGARWFSDQGTVVKGKFGRLKSTPVQEELEKLHSFTNEACRDHSGPGAIKVKPRRGSVALLYHDHVNGEGDPQAWHCGCKPLSGEKWTMQKFKETPLEHRAHY